MEVASELIDGGGDEEDGRRLRLLLAKLRVIDEALDSNRLHQQSLNQIVEAEKGITESLYWYNITDYRDDEKELIDHKQELLDQIDKTRKERDDRCERSSRLGRLAARLLAKY